MARDTYRHVRILFSNHIDCQITNMIWSWLCAFFSICPLTQALYNEHLRKIRLQTAQNQHLQKTQGGGGGIRPAVLYRHSRDGALAGRLAVCWGCANFLRL